MRVLVGVVGVGVGLFVGAWLVFLFVGLGVRGWDGEEGGGFGLGFAGAGFVGG